MILPNLKKGISDLPQEIKALKKTKSDELSDSDYKKTSLGKKVSTISNSKIIEEIKEEDEDPSFYVN
jgi:hypothetical protein